MKKIPLLFILFSICLMLLTSVKAADYISGSRLDFWLQNYSVMSQRAVIVLPGVEIADAASLNGKIPPVTQNSKVYENIREELLRIHGIELVLFRDDLAVCMWTEKEEHAAAKQRAKQELAAVGLAEEKIPQRIIVDKKLRLKVESSR
ncbi:MAG: hypothetical protein AAF546_12400 [Verrucomicrobiota bacterium]